MILIVGLGNPGKHYEGTRHNAGFMVVDKLADELSITFTKQEKFQSLVARSDVKDAILLKPQTFMNLSGHAVQKVASFYKIKPEHIWVIYDDADLPVGTVRIRSKGTGEGKHNGVRSIISALKTAEFPRFRIGIAPASPRFADEKRPHNFTELKDFVLMPFDRREQALVKKAIVWAVSEIVNAIKVKHVVSRTLTKGM